MAFVDPSANVKLEFCTWRQPNTAADLLDTLNARVNLQRRPTPTPELTQMLGPPLSG